MHVYDIVVYNNKLDIKLVVLSQVLTLSEDLKIVLTVQAANDFGLKRHDVVDVMRNPCGLC